MQRIKLNNNVEITNVNVVNAYTEMIGENDRRETLQIIISNNTVENLSDVMLSNTSVLDRISIYDENGEELQGIQERYNIPCSMTKNLINNTIEVKVARKSNLEQQLLETQLALAELGQIIGGAL
mgnify:CR=1 FL=1